MDRLLLTLINFSKSNLNTLAVKIVDNFVDSATMLKIGFVNDGEYFTITKDKANLFLYNYLMQDYIKHWNWERTRYNG